MNNNPYLTKIQEIKKENEYTREYFDNPNNKLQDKDLKVGDHFILDLYPVYGNGEGRNLTDVDICEVEVTKDLVYHKERGQKFNFRFIRKVTTGKQFGYPNGYWKVKRNDKLKTAVEFLQMTKDEIKHNPIDEFCQCGHSKKAHLPHSLDNNGGKCAICSICDCYTWKGFEFNETELENINSALKEAGEGK
jgi:hypothetical protein